MTLLDVRNQIVSKLCTKTTFAPEDFDAVKVRPEFEDRKEAMVLAALDELSIMGMVRPIHGDSTIWMLSSPLGMSGQQVHISMGTAVQIADIINTYLGANDLGGEPADALNIAEIDIITIIGILGDILSIDPNDLGEKEG